MYIPTELTQRHSSFRWRWKKRIQTFIATSKLAVIFTRCINFPTCLAVLLDVHVIRQWTRLDVMLCRPGYQQCKGNTMQSPSVTWYAGAMAKCDCYLVTTYGKVFEGGGGEGDRFSVMWVSCDSWITSSWEWEEAPVHQWSKSEMLLCNVNACITQWINFTLLLFSMVTQRTSSPSWHYNTTTTPDSFPLVMSVCSGMYLRILHTQLCQVYVQ